MELMLLHITGQIQTEALGIIGAHLAILILTQAKEAREECGKEG